MARHLSDVAHGNPLAVLVFEITVVFALNLLFQIPLIPVVILRTEKATFFNFSNFNQVILKSVTAF